MKIIITLAVVGIIWALATLLAKAND